MHAKPPSGGGHFPRNRNHHFEQPARPYSPHCYRRKLAKWTLLGAGLGSLLWFLVRVVPKPSRAAYPCQRAAAPFASAFVLWLLAIIGAKWAMDSRRLFLRRARPVAAGGCTLVLALFVALAVRSVPENPGQADPSPHGPLGVGQGIHPGRVVWVHAPDATDWAGYTSAERWCNSNHTDLAVVENMMSESIRALTGEADDAAAWRALFTHFNRKQGRGQRGYQGAEKIAIKLNLTTSNGGSDCNTNAAVYDKVGHLNRIDNSPQMVLALLRQLIYVAGVPATNISLGDPTALFPGFIWSTIHGEFPGVAGFDILGYAGRKRVAFSTVPMSWSTSAADGKLRDYIPEPFAEADYLINFAILKGHSSGVTLCGKNLYGALKRTPDGGLYGSPRKLNYYDLHLSLPNNTPPEAAWSPGMGRYRAIVDLLASRHLGGKTFLYLVDGLFAGYYWDSQPRPWKKPPFGDGTNGDWPSSLFASQDPVAIDSVCYDFLLNEWPAVVKNGTGATNSLQGGAEDYLHEAALADSPPSGTVYLPDGNASQPRSLGLHEHWSNPVDRQYSRNMGGSNGIELVSLKLAKSPPRLRLRLEDSKVALAWSTSQPGYRLQSATQLSAVPDWTDVPGIPASHQAQYVVTHDVSAGVRFYRLVK